MGGPGSSGGRGSVGLGLRLAHGTAMQQVGYHIKGNGVDDQGAVPVTGSGSSVNGGIASVNAGSGYALSILGMSFGGQSCQGTASIDVGSGQNTGTAIPLYCSGQTNGFFDNLGHFFQCPLLGGAWAYPTEAAVGAAIHVSGPYVLFRNVTYTWTTSGGGTFADSTARRTDYTCTSAGNQTLTVTITDTYGCNKSLSIDVTCGNPPPTPVCGNGIVEPGEQCDDGNTVSGDGCSSTCMIEAPPAVCGNGIVEPGEQCDDGNTVSGDGCSSTCQIETPAPVCGNGVVDPGETCDGNCPTSCDDGNACTTDTMTGSPSTCNVQCGSTPVTACVSGDGCCPAGCNATNDSDCSPTCGNGIVETGETCDGNCPTSCDDGNACTTDTMTGSAASCDAVCHNTPITACVDNDGCCPPGCDSTDDNDCASVCGNGIVETGETCDGNCPTSCDDGNACTTDTMTGSAANCDVQCHNTPITACVNGDGCCPAGCNATNDSDCSPTCGNGIVETGETCDGNCPTSCDDGNACTTDTMTGSAANCNVQCTNTPITACKSGDGCCPAGCNASNDSDCSPVCGNGVIETGETCDGNCPTSCDDGIACTTDTMTGSAATCDAVCTHTPNNAACDDGNECTTDVCTSSGCQHTPVADGTACSSGTCQAGTCTSSTTTYRINTIQLVDPHVIVDAAGGLVCADITNTPLDLGTLGSIPALNDALATSVSTDSTGDGLLDLSYTLSVSGLNQTDGATASGYVVASDCTDPTTCMPTSGATPVAANITVHTTGGSCLTAPGIETAVWPDGTMSNPNNPVPGANGCFVSDPTTFTLSASVSGTTIQIPLTQVQIAGTLNGSPATGITNGVISGFLPETVADNITITASGLTLSLGTDLLPDNGSACPGDPRTHCQVPAPTGGTTPPPTPDARDVLSDGTCGWWFTLNYTADTVTNATGY